MGAKLMDLPKRALIIGMCALGLTMGNGGPASGISLDFANTPDATLSFYGGASPYFAFNNNPSGNSFTITAVHDGAGGDTVGLPGSIAGTFVIGPVQPDNSATVINQGDLTITDKDGSPFTAKVLWYTIFSVGTAGGINDDATVNLSNIHYSGANPDLQGWGADQTATVAFGFNPGKDLSALTAEPYNATAFSGTLSAVPAPAVVLLLGTGLAGLAGLRLRGRRKG
jgi:hypothetical protein